MSVSPAVRVTALVSRYWRRDSERLRGGGTRKGNEVRFRGSQGAVGGPEEAGGVPARIAPLPPGISFVIAVCVISVFLASGVCDILRFDGLWLIH